MKSWGEFCIQLNPLECERNIDNIWFWWKAKCNWMALFRKLWIGRKMIIEYLATITSTHISHSSVISRAIYSMSGLFTVWDRCWGLIRDLTLTSKSHEWQWLYISKSARSWDLHSIRKAKGKNGWIQRIECSYSWHMREIVIQEITEFISKEK